MVAVTVLLIGLVACTGNDESGATTLQGMTMGTTYSVTVVNPPDQVELADLRRKIAATLTRIESMASTYRDDSEISQINQSAATRWLPISAEFCGFLEATWQLRSATKGAFDITIGPLVDLWGFGTETTSDQRLPTPFEIASVREQIATANIRLDCSQPAVMKANASTRIDMSGWAKGYAVDQVAALLDRAEIGDYLVEIGGEIKVQGHNARGEVFAVGIEHPRSVGDVIASPIRVTNMGVATSGDYRSFREVDDVRYSHTIDPRTGWPVAHDLASVTVLHPSVARADAFATALLVMGPVHGLVYANDNEIAALFVRVSPDGVHTEQSDQFPIGLSPTQN